MQIFEIKACQIEVDLLQTAVKLAYNLLHEQASKASPEAKEIIMQSARSFETLGNRMQQDIEKQKAV